MWRGDGVRPPLAVAVLCGRSSRAVVSGAVAHEDVMYRRGKRVSGRGGGKGGRGEREREMSDSRCRPYAAGGTSVKP